MKPAERGVIVDGSTIYTIGTALNRAREANLRVEILAEGHWLAGLVLAVDGHGAVLSDDDLGHAVIRMESIAAVKVLHAATARTAPAGPGAPAAATSITRAWAAG